MLKFGIIGTNWISEKFIEAAHHTEHLKLEAVYSRKIDRAKAFAHKYQASHYFDDLEKFAKCVDLDAVYIASPNALHCEQAILMMQHKKHVICEKPIASNLIETERMFAVAKAQNMVLFEAYKTQYLPNFAALQKAITKIGKIHKAHFSYCQYSSRYPQYLSGLLPNTFNPQFSNGSLVDIGFYCVSAAIALFGSPLAITSNAQLLPTGVDAHGSALFDYGEFSVQITHSKVTNGYAPSEIQGEEGSILIPHIAELNEFTIHDRDGSSEKIAFAQKENAMFYEALAFAKQCQQAQLSNPEQTLKVAKTLTLIRQQTGIIYPAD